MLKSIVFFYLLALVTANAVRFELNDNIRQFLARVKVSDLPQPVQLSLVSKQGRGPGDSSHWCCINDQPLISETQTKIEYASRIVTTKTKVGYVDCGLFGISKCSHWVTVTKIEMYSFIQTFQIPNMAACPSTEMRCCSNYINVAGNCHSITELIANQELFEFLSSLGLLGGVSVGK